MVISSDSARRERRKSHKQGTVEITTMNPRRLEEMIRADILELTKTSKATGREQPQWLPMLKQNLADSRRLFMVHSFCRQKLQMSNKKEQNVFEGIFTRALKFQVIGFKAGLERRSKHFFAKLRTNELFFGWQASKIYRQRRISNQRHQQRLVREIECWTFPHLHLR